ncbi:hypothetical protein KFE25_007586 [Diacronema lutheri]|uniref:Uncharacterized protein n=1 Tax=Diacronema lutheri TaxID=2081491 RepID=A0A8J5XJN4_DIALT|nr:hypothetical protein KFE25_007586 [Diacronema lutheri]
MGLCCSTNVKTTEQMPPAAGSPSLREGRRLGPTDARAHDGNGLSHSNPPTSADESSLGEGDGARGAVAQPTSEATHAPIDDETRPLAATTREPELEPSSTVPETIHDQIGVQDASDVYPENDALGLNSESTITQPYPPGASAQEAHVAHAAAASEAAVASEVASGTTAEAVQPVAEARVATPNGLQPQPQEHHDSDGEHVLATPAAMSAVRAAANAIEQAQSSAPIAPAPPQFAKTASADLVLVPRPSSLKLPSPAADMNATRPSHVDAPSSSTLRSDDDAPSAAGGACTHGASAAEGRAGASGARNAAPPMSGHAGGSREASTAASQKASASHSPTAKAEPGDEVQQPAKTLESAGTDEADRAPPGFPASETRAAAQQLPAPTEQDVRQGADVAAAEPVAVPWAFFGGFFGARPKAQSMQQSMQLAANAPTTHKAATQATLPAPTVANTPAGSAIATAATEAERTGVIEPAVVVNGLRDEPPSPPARLTGARGTVADEQATKPFFAFSLDSMHA